MVEWDLREPGISISQIIFDLIELLRLSISQCTFFEEIVLIYDIFVCCDISFKKILCFEVCGKCWSDQLKWTKFKYSQGLMDK